MFADRVLADIGDESSELARLQVALFETWRRRAAFDDDLVTSYLAVGGISGALANVADDLYKSKLDDQQREEAKRAFLQLC